MLKEIENKEQELWNLRRYKGEVAENEGDVWHDNFAFEQTEIEERMLIKQISEMREAYSNIEVVNEVYNVEIVQLGNIVTVELIFEVDDREVSTFYITGWIGDDKKTLSVNSPLGNALLNNSAGYEGIYSVNNEVIGFKILKIS